MAGLLDALVGGAAGGAAGSIFGIPSALISANAATQASNAQQRGARQAQGQITAAYNQATGYQQPYYDTGTQNMKTLSGMVNGGQFKTDPYNYQLQPQGQFNFATDPGYQFRMQQGQNQINSGAAAGGTQLSGATMKALARYNQGMASNEVNNAYGRYNQDRSANQQQQQMGMNNAMNQYNTANQQATQQYGQFNNLAEMGQQAAGNLANLASNYGQNMANTTIQGANAAAAGAMGRGNAYSGMMNNMQQGATLGAMMNYNQPAPAQDNQNIWGF